SRVERVRENGKSRPLRPQLSETRSRKTTRFKEEKGMRKWFIAAATALSLFALSLSAMAASPGATLPPGASEVAVYYRDSPDSEWLETKGDTARARSWNSLPVNSSGYSNKQHHTI